MVIPFGIFIPIIPCCSHVKNPIAGGKPTKPLLEVNCHHNNTEKEVHYGEEGYVTRKGAIRALSPNLIYIPKSLFTY
jgi:tRNA-splicing ligase RtcB (3'-phosphate/5'-hydroxy nucleic acid ligase)